MIFAHLVVKNEADRYLDAALKNISKHVDKIFVYDDQSTDDTALVSSQTADITVIRDERGASFQEDEGAFRRDSYALFEEEMNPQPGVDWVFSLDADEFPIFESIDLKSLTLNDTVSAYEFKIPEVFLVQNGVPLVRTDGFWKDIRGVRFFRWQGVGSFPDRQLAPGSVPTYALQNVKQIDDPVILHYGYAKEEDRVKKYARYFGNPGHNAKHIQSILRSPSLKGWTGEVPVL